MKAPGQLLRELEARGFHFRVADDKLMVRPTPIPRDVDDLIKANRDALISLLLGRCPSCGNRLTTGEQERYRYVECIAEPIHYFEAINKRPGQPMGLFTDVGIGKCAGCGTEGETFNGRCEACHAREEQEQEGAA